MILELNIDEFSTIKPLLKRVDLEQHPVINGVVEGNNLGSIFVDDVNAPTVALVWAQMEMFYLIGDSGNEAFNSLLEPFILNHIKPKALAIGDLDFNLETYPLGEWNQTIRNFFKVTLSKGLRVPFVFDKDLFKEYVQTPYQIYTGYEVHRIDERIVEIDKEMIIKGEILKFWESLEKFFQNGLGYCVLKDNAIIGTCISVFVSGQEFEIGINTYGTEHRGKGLASVMAREFICECLENNATPHWTTEDFRKDSIAIAEKMGFLQQPKYIAYFIPFVEWNNQT